MIIFLCKKSGFGEFQISMIGGGCGSKVILLENEEGQGGSKEGTCISSWLEGEEGDLSEGHKRRGD
jgi:hypothetical protein